MRSVSSPLCWKFIGRVIVGRGRGMSLDRPTINLSRKDIPKSLQQGVYACRVRIGKTTRTAVAHYGPRPVFRDSLSFEVHIIDEVLSSTPRKLEVEVVRRLRSVRSFPSVSALLRQISKDVARTKRII